MRSTLKQNQNAMNLEIKNGLVLTTSHTQNMFLFTSKKTSLIFGQQRSLEGRTCNAQG